MVIRIIKAASMKAKVTTTLIVCLVAGGFFHCMSSKLRAEEVFVTIGSGDFSGVYFPAGLAIAKIINHRRVEFGMRAAVQSTPGSVFNLNALAAGYLDFGLAQADEQYLAVKGLGAWAKKGPQDQLRAVFSLYRESVTLVAAVDAGINSILDLKGKRVNLGSPRSGGHLNAVEALEAVSIDPAQDLVAKNVRFEEAPPLLQDNWIDAFFCTVGHPSETVRAALSGKREVRIVPISAPAIDRLVADKKYYMATTIPARRIYPNLAGPAEVKTIGVIATLCTTASVPEPVVYTLTKVVFANFDEFRRQHPAFRNLIPKEMLEGLSAPLHPGALKYFKEIGLKQ
jgi:TRAP transporter TAXI family solute receptor